MGWSIKFKRGTTAQVAAETPKVGEPIWDSENNILYIGDGSTAGGIIVGPGSAPAAHAIPGSHTFSGLTIGHVLRASGATAAAFAAIAAGDLPTGIDAAKISAGDVSNTEFDFLNGVTSAIQTQLGNKLANVIEDTTPQLGGDLDAQDNAITALKKLVFGIPVELTISGGAVTITRSGHLIDTEGDAATDDLTTINGGSPGQLLFIIPVSSAREVVIKHGTGNIWMHAKADYRLQDVRQGVFFVLVGGWWVDISREITMDEADWGIIHDFTNFGELVAGSGSTVRDIRRAVGVTGMTADSYGQAYKGLSPEPYNFDKDMSFYIVFMPYAFGANTVGYITLQQQQAASDPNNKAFGFRLDHLALKGIVHNGTSLAVVDLSTTLTNSTKYALKMAYTAGSKIEWFVDGVLKGSSTHLPSGTLVQTSLVVAAKNPANGLNFATHEVGRWAYRQSW